MLTAFIFMVKDKYGLFLTFLFVKSFITFAQLTSNTFIIKLKKKTTKKTFFQKRLYPCQRFNEYQPYLILNLMMIIICYPYVVIFRLYLFSPVLLIPNFFKENFRVHFPSVVPNKRLNCLNINY